MSALTERLIKHGGFTVAQATVLEEMYPEVERDEAVESDVKYRIVRKPVHTLASSAVAASCASTATDEVLASLSIPAGTLGLNSILQIEPLWTFTSSANNKFLKVKIGGSTVYTATRTTSVKEAPLIVLANRNSLASQIQPYDNTYMTAASGAPATYAINFALTIDLEITGQRVNGADALALQYFRILHFIGD